MKEASAAMTKLLQELDQRQELSSLMYREIMLTRIRTGLAFDAACCTTVDPQTLLTTGAITEQGLERIHGALLDNEYLHDDYNKFAGLARSNAAASSLWEATGGRPELSRRYREVLQPAGFADELRVALRTGEACWGFLILFRKAEQGPFQQEELQLIRDIAPLIAGRLKAKALSPAALTDSGGQPEEGIIILDDRLEPVSQNPGGRYWLEQLQRMEQQSRPALPGPVRAVSLRALAGERPAADGRALGGEPQAEQDAGGGLSAGGRPAGGLPAGELPQGGLPADNLPSGVQPLGERLADRQPTDKLPAAGRLPAPGELPRGVQPAGELPLGERLADRQPTGKPSAAGESAAAARVCFRAPDGRFINITASRLDGPSGLIQLAVSFTAAKAADLLPMVTEAYGFTEREKEIVEQLSKGHSTKELALNLHISAYTVQDHLKSIFSKAGVSSRRELIWLLYSRYQ